MLTMAVRLKKLQNVRTLIRNRSYATATITHTDSNDSMKKVKKDSLYSRIIPLGSPNLLMTPELDDWIRKGKKVRHSELRQIVHDLRKRRRFNHALEVSEWMNKCGNFKFTPADHAVQLDLIGKVHGFLEAEKHFDSLTEQYKTDKTYGALLHCYVRQSETEKSLTHFQKMKENGFGLSPVPYNDIMCLYIRTGQTGKIQNVLTEMKKNGVSPDNLTYRICIDSYGVNLDTERMEKMLTEMEKDPNIVMDWNTYAAVAYRYFRRKLLDKANDALKKAENRLIEKDAVGYNHLITLHTSLENRDDVVRLWCRLKTVCKRLTNREYIGMLRALVKLGEFEEAEKLLAEWHTCGNCYDFQVPLIIIDGYLDNGLCYKPKDLLDNLLKMGKPTTVDSWRNVAFEFLEKGDKETSGKCMEIAKKIS